MNVFISNKANTIDSFVRSRVPNINENNVRYFSQPNRDNAFSRPRTALQHDSAEVHETVTVGQFTVILERVKVDIYSLVVSNFGLDPCCFSDCRTSFDRQLLRNWTRCCDRP